MTGLSVCIWVLTAVILVLPGLPEGVRGSLYGYATCLLYVPGVYLAYRLQRGNQGDRATRRAWRLSSGALACAGVANALQHPIFSTILGVSAYLLGVVGLHAFPAEPMKDGRHPRLKQALDALIAFTGALMLFWTFVLVPRWTDLGPGVARVMSMFQLCMGFACLMAAASVLLGRPARGIVVSVRLFAGGLIVLFGVGIAVDIFRFTGWPLTVINIVRGIANIMFTMAAAHHLRRTMSADLAKTVARTRPRDIVTTATLVPYAFVVAGYLLMLLKAFTGASPMLINGLIAMATVATLLVTARQGTVLLDSARLSAALHFQATHDELTGALNRRALFVEERQPAFRVTSHATYSALVIDVDHFKTINDTYGHEVGDDALKAIVGTLQSRLRTNDSLFRLGGDEFVIVLAATAVDGAARVATDLLERVASIEIHPEIVLTLSIGITAAHDNDEVVDAVLARADEALYEAKRAGRACYRVYTEPATTEPEPVTPVQPLARERSSSGRRPR